MNLVWVFYLIGALENFLLIFGGVFGISVTTIFLCCIFMGMSSEDEKAHFIKVSKGGAICAAVSLPFLLFLPSQETAYTMLAAYGVEEIISSERVQAVGGKSLELIEQFLDEKLKAE